MEQEGDAKRLADIAKKSPEYLTRVQKLWDSANSWPTDKTNAKTYNLQILLQTGGFLSPLPAHADGGFGDNVLKAVNKFEKFPKPAASLSDTFDAARIIPKAQPPVFKGPATETAANPQISRLQPPTRR